MFNKMDLVNSTLAKARATWPKFVELEPQIVQLLQKHYSWSLNDAYAVAYKELENANKWISTASYSYCSPKTAVNYTSEPPISWSIGGGSPTQAEAPVAASNLPSPSPLQDAAVPSDIWTFKQFQRDLLPFLQAESRDFGYHLCLGGSVLNAGKSKKDLDIYYLPLGGDKPRDPKGLIGALIARFGEAKLIGKDHKYPMIGPPYIAKLKFTPNLCGRIDVFVIGNSEDVFDVKSLIRGSVDIVINLGMDRIVKV